jgi:hypothetical protein
MWISCEQWNSLLLPVVCSILESRRGYLLVKCTFGYKLITLVHVYRRVRPIGSEDVLFPTKCHTPNFFVHKKWSEKEQKFSPGDNLFFTTWVFPEIPYVSPTEEFWPSRPFQLASVILKMCDHMNINCICVSVKCKNVLSAYIHYRTRIVLAVMCICVIYKCLSRDSDQL